MESYKPKTQLPSVAKSSTTRNSTNLESTKVENDLQFPSIDDIKCGHSDDNRAMSKDEAEHIQSNPNLHEYLGKEFNYYKGTTVANEYNLEFMAHRKNKFNSIKAERDELHQRHIAISVQSEESEEDAATRS